MANETIIVSYEQLNNAVQNALSKQPDALLEAPKKPAPKGYEAFESNEPMATDEEAAALNENLVRALKILEAEQRHSGVLASPDDRFTSLLQSQLAENALLSGQVEPGKQGLEAKFDERGS
ncbi:MAG TPA: hypothetical protein VFD48_14535, partial [Pyrinomonadaceae bacterium]|nr:hypothetical protein [Pyrinomonadaceae bacterium]